MAHPAAATPRLPSLDAFRGMTVAGMILVNNPGSWSHVYAPLRHAEWHGCTPTDLVFPFFLFIAGAAIPLALGAARGRGATRGVLTLRALRRALVLVVLGWVLASPTAKGFGPLFAGLFAACALSAVITACTRKSTRQLLLAAAWASLGLWLVASGPPIRIPGVLQRIGVCYGLAACAYLWLPRRTLPWLTAALLAGYWALLVWVPVPGHGAGLLDSKAHNLASYLDRWLLEGHLWVAGERDPEGPLSTLGALATTLLGISVGALLQRTPPGAALRPLLVRGVVLAAAGAAASPWLPINKPLWTSSYALWTAGLATAALAGFHRWLDRGEGHRAGRGAGPLLTFGLNPITVFVGSGLAARSVAQIEVGEGGSVRQIWMDSVTGWGVSPPGASLAYAATWVAAWYVVLRALQARGVVIKV